MNPLSIAHYEVTTAKDSVVGVTAAIYEAKEGLKDAEKEKLRNWLNQRLAVKNVEIFKKQ